ncbi:MAG: proteasome subunit beta [Candidatus Diapherotrites archaeon]|nr:proteasome subunit beta [Candidatus Diapherotrites archaeon]
MTQELNELKTGTTTVAIVFGQGVVLGADQRASMGHLAYDEESPKIYTISDKIAVTNAGSVGDSQVIVRFMKSQVLSYELERQAKMTPQALATFLSNVMNANRYYPFISQFLIAGVNSGPEIFELEPFGGVLERPKYAVSGSGTELALSVLDSNYRSNLSEEEALSLAAKAVKAATKRDIYSGGKSISLCVVDAKGVRHLSQPEVLKVLDRQPKLGA